MLVVAFINIIAVFIGGTVAILRLRAQTGVEMAASMRLAESLVGDVIKLAVQQGSAEQFLTSLPTQLNSIRHVRVTVKDAVGTPVVSAPPAGSAKVKPMSAAGRFAALLAPRVEFRQMPVIVGGRPIGSVEIVGEPGDEMAEFCENAAAIGTLVLLLEAAVIGILYVLFGRVLDPLAALAAGLSALEAKNYSVRLRTPAPGELAAITNHFNLLALALETARTENLSLGRRLITAQDDERRNTALELHDEVGPCLFGLQANISSVANAVDALPEEPKLRVLQRLREIQAIIDHLQLINRSMLERLRPMALGHVPLNEIVEQLVQNYARQHPQIAFFCNANGLERSYGDLVDLTIYRCTQEGLTNAIRHAQARKVFVDLVDTAGQIVLNVRDDGCGIYPGMVAGHGLRGMEERVAGLDGRYTIESTAGQGTCVRVMVPLADLEKCAER